MDHYAGIDVSLEASHICVVDSDGKRLKEAKVSSEPAALIAWFGAFGMPIARIGLEAGPLSQWLYAGMNASGLAVELLETRHVRDAFKSMPVKTDRKDARGIAQLMRLGWFAVQASAFQVTPSARSPRTADRTEISAIKVSNDRQNALPGSFSRRPTIKAPRCRNVHSRRIARFRFRAQSWSDYAENV